MQTNIQYNQNEGKTYIYDDDSVEGVTIRLPSVSSADEEPEEQISAHQLHTIYEASMETPESSLRPS